MNRRFWIIAVFIIFTALLCAQTPQKKGVNAFVNYLQQNQPVLNYVSFAQKDQNGQVEIRVICREDTQQKLINAIGDYAALKYAFEKNAAGDIVFICQFVKEPAAAAGSSSSVKCPGTVKVSTWKAETVPYDEYIELSGKANLRKVLLSASIVGTVKEVNVTTGSQVRQGELLAVIEGATVDELAKLEADVKKAENVWKARKNWKTPSEKAIQQAEAKYQESLALFEQKKASAAFPVTSPCTGKVLSVSVAAGQPATIGAPLVELVNMDQPDALFSGSDDDLALFSVGESVSITSEKSGIEFRAVVAQVSSGNIQLTVENADGRIRQDDSLVLRKLKKHHDEAVLLPVAWIQKNEIGTYVYMVDIREARLRYITVGSEEKEKKLVLVGIVKGNEIITSGFECLRDGKKIKSLTPTAAGETVKPTTPKPTVEKPKVPVVKEPKPKKEPQVKTEPATTEGEQPRFRVGLTFGRFTVSDENLSEFYGHSWRNLPGFEAAVHIKYNIDIWAAYKVYTQETTTTVFENPVKFRLSPLLLGAIYRIQLKNTKRFEPYIGAGLNFYSYSEKIEGETDLDNTKGSAVGFHFQGGTYVQIWKSVYGGLYFRYNSVSKNLEDAIPGDIIQLKLGGVEFGIGFYYRF